MGGGRGNKKRVQYCTDSSEQEILHLRAFQGHWGRNPIDPSLQDSVLIPNNFFEYISHIGCAVSLHSITNSGLIAGGQNSSRERQTVFFTAVNSMNKEHRDPHELDLTKPRLASYKQKAWRRHQDTVYWVDIQLLQRKGLKFYQTRCNAIILYDTLPAYCISKVVVMKSEEIIYLKVYMCHLDHHRRFPTKIIGWTIWMLTLLEAAKIPNESNQNPKPNCQVRWDPYVDKESTKEIEKRTVFDHDTLSQEKHDEVTDSTSTGRPVLVDQKEEHAVVKEAEHLRVQQSLWKRIETHPHREALHADLQQNSVYNPFSKNSKAIIRELGNVEFFELCVTFPKVQCCHCLLYWNQGIVYCNCEQCLIDSESRRSLTN